MIVVIVLPYLLTVTTPLLPAGPTDWLARVTPAAAFAVQQTLIAYPQVEQRLHPVGGLLPARAVGRLRGALRLGRRRPGPRGLDC